MRFLRKAFGLLLGVTVVSTVVITDAQAVPAFARQTGMACNSCHAGAFPAINSFGRAFRAQGYTMRGAAPLVEGEDLSIPSDLKASVVAKLRYTLDGETDGGRGLLQWPEEAALLIGGRAGEKVGFLLESALNGVVVESETNTGTGAVTFTDVTPGGCAAAPTDPAQCTVTADTGDGAGEAAVASSFLSFKTHFNVTDNVAAVLFTTDGLGVGYGMELMNTGLARSQRAIENRMYAAAQRVGNASGGATGVALVYHDNNLMVNYSHWAPSWGDVDANLAGGLAHYLRVNYFVMTNGWDLGFGANWMGGTVEVGKTDPAGEVNVASQGVDFQAIGEMLGMPAQFYASYGVAPKSSAGDVNHYNSSTTDDLIGMGVLGKLGVAKNTNFYVGVGNSDGAKEFSDTTIGVQYMLGQNMNVELYNVNSSSAKKTEDVTRLQLFIGF